MAPQTADPASDTDTIIDRPCWAHAYVDRQANTLTLYRSVLLAADDPWLEPAERRLVGAKLVKRAIVSDPGMMLGQAEHSLYLLGP